MFVATYFKEAYANLIASKMRSLLAILGILVGTGSVVAMVLCGQLATEAALAQFKALGTNLLSVALFDNNQGGDNPTKNSKEFDLNTALNIVTASPDILQVAPYTTSYLPVSFMGHTLTGGGIIGATYELQDVIKINLREGRFISFLDDYTYYCMIGHSLYQQIKQFTFKEPIGQQIYLGTTIFTIVGIAGEWTPNQFFGNDINNSVIIPLSTSTILSKYAIIRNIVMRLNENANIDEVTAKITQYLTDVTPDQKPFIQSAKQIIESMISQRHILTILLGLIGSISLLVGGIGVMNIMLVSVIERKREIGIRKAVGATRRDIRLLFLIEAVALSVFGGLMGVIIGLFTAAIIAHFAGWHFMLFFTPPLVGFTVSVATGIFFGFYPAFKAAQLDPIVALRTE